MCPNLEYGFDWMWTWLWCWKLEMDTDPELDWRLDLDSKLNKAIET